MLWFLLLFQPLFAQQLDSDVECRIGSLNPLASSSGNACYKLYDTPKSFQAARNFCVEQGGQLAAQIDREASSLYSSNADLEGTNSAQFWVGASNLQCNVGWETGEAIGFNDMWASNSRFYGVAIDKMSLGGLWHTVPVGQQLPFVCTFHGHKNNATVPIAPVHAMRAPAKKRPTTTTTISPEDDIDDSLNAALANKKPTTTSAPSTSTTSTTVTTKKPDPAAADLALRKDIGRAVAVLKSQEMGAQSPDFDDYTEADLLSAAATLMGGYQVNMYWADRSTRNVSWWESTVDERMLSLVFTFAEQRALELEKKMKKPTSAEPSDADADLQAAAAVLADEATTTTTTTRKSTTTKTPTTTSKTTTTLPTTTKPDDIDDSMKAGLGHRKATTTSTPSTSATTIVPILSGAVGPRKEISGCPAQWTQFNANATAPAFCFRRFVKPMNFEDARLFCVSKGGHLASLHNEKQLLLLSALLHNNGQDTIDNQTWIGLNRIHQKYYVFEDESPMDFTRWLPGAPNINDCTVFTGNELPNYPHQGTQYKFGDFPCEQSQKSVLCEVTLGSDKESSVPSCEEGWSFFSHDGVEEHGKCYKHLEQSKTFKEAREVCRNEDAYVASVQNEAEARFVAALVDTVQNYTIDEQTWIGYVKYDRDFGWEDGSAGVQFDPWTEKLPRQKKCTAFTGNEIHEDCRSKFRFVSVACDKKQRAVLCSKPPMKNGVKFVYKPTQNTAKSV